MIINSAQFVKGVIGSDPILKEKLPQVAFVGRSNVGKSSMINSLVRMKSLVKSSSTPGRTREINFFLVNDKLYFVDLPGYGYAKMSASHADKMRKMIIWYLEQSKTNIKKVILIIDANVGPKQFDIDMKNLLEKAGHDFLIVANKADKLNQKDKYKIEQMMKEVFPDQRYIFYSSKTGKGKDQVFENISF